MLFSMQAYSQACTPFWNDPGYGIVPDTIINLPPAYAGSPYDVVVQFKVPPKAPFGNDSVDVDHVVLDSVSGLTEIPSSSPFYFQCNPVDCSFKHDSVGCVRIQGTPTTLGTYNLVIATRVYITPYLYLPFPTPGYRIVVHNPIGISTVSTSVFDVSQNVPNPVSSETDVCVNMVHPGNFTVKISNLVGNEMLKHEIAGKKGMNTVHIDASGFAPGVYFYCVSDGMQAITRRMVVDRN